MMEAGPDSVVLHVGDCEHGRLLQERAKEFDLRVEVGEGDSYWHCAECAYAQDREAGYWRNALRLGVDVQEGERPHHAACTVDDHSGECSTCGQEWPKAHG